VKKRIGLIFAALFLLGAIVGCGNTTEPIITEDPPPLTQDPAETSADTTPDEPVIPEDDAPVDEEPEDPIEETPEENFVDEVLAAQATDKYTNIMNLLSLGQDNSGAYSLEFIMVVDMYLGLEHLTQTTTTGTMKMIVDGENATSHTLAITELSGTSTEMEILIEKRGDEFLEVRLFVDGEELDPEILGLDAITSMLEESISLPDFSENAIKSVNAEEVEGNTITTIMLHGEMLRDFAMDSITEQLAALGSLEIELEVDDVFVELVTDADGAPLSMAMEMAVYMNIEGESVTMLMSSEYVFIGFGDAVTI